MWVLVVVVGRKIGLESMVSRDVGTFRLCVEYAISNGIRVPSHLIIPVEEVLP